MSSLLENYERKKDKCGCQNGRVYDYQLKEVVPCPNCELGEKRRLEVSLKEDGSSFEQILPEINDDIFEAVGLFEEKYKQWKVIQPNFSDEISDKSVSAPNIRAIFRLWGDMIQSIRDKHLLSGNYFFHIQNYDFRHFAYHFLMQAKATGYSVTPFVNSKDLFSISKVTYGFTNADTYDIIRHHQNVAKRIGYTLDDFEQADVVAIELDEMGIVYQSVSNVVASLLRGRAKLAKPTYIFSDFRMSRMTSSGNFTIKELEGFHGNNTHLTIMEAVKTESGKPIVEDPLFEVMKTEMYSNREVEPVNEDDEDSDVDAMLNYTIESLGRFDETGE